MLAGPDFKLVSPVIRTATLPDLKAIDATINIATILAKPEPGAAVVFLPKNIATFIPESIINPGATAVPDDFSGLHAGALQELFDQVWRAAESDFAVLSGHPFTVSQTVVGECPADEFFSSYPGFHDIDEYVIAEYSLEAGAAGSCILSQVFPVEYWDRLFRSFAAPQDAQAASMPEDISPVTFDSPIIEENAKKTSVEKQFVEKLKAMSKATRGPVEKKKRELDFHGEMKTKIDAIGEVPVEVVGQLANSRMKAGLVLGIGPGSVIDFENSSTEPIKLLVNGYPVATAEVVTVGDKFALRIVELGKPTPKPHEL